MDGTILAYDMNLAPLTAKHGYPVRAIVPGLETFEVAKLFMNSESVSPYIISNPMSLAIDCILVSNTD